MLTKMEKDKESYSKSKATMMELTIFLSANVSNCDFLLFIAISVARPCSTYTPKRLMD